MKKVLLTIAVVVGIVSLAQAAQSSRTLIIKQERENANAMAASAQMPVGWQHLNRFARENAEKGTLGGTYFESAEQQVGPKNYRNKL